MTKITDLKPGSCFQGCASGSRMIFLVLTTHHDPERVIW
jgi:hypothetical protein